MGRIQACLFLYVVLSLLIFPLVCWGQATTQGQWSVAPNPMPINPVHVALLANGKILVVAGSGNCGPAQSGCPSAAPYGQSNNSGALLWDPSTENYTQWFSLTWDMFCNAMVLLPDGRAFVDGGTIQYDPFYGQPKSSIFDPVTNTFSDTANMAHGRWYPTVLTLGDGRLMTFSGLTETGGTNASVEFYSTSSGWSAPYTAPWTPDLYPRFHLLPDGKVFYSGSRRTSKLFDPSTETWTTNFATTNYSGTRTYGTSILLPLTPANNYDPKVIIMGGGNPATNTTELIDLGASSPKWVYGPPMSESRIEMNAVLLPNGKVLAIGGSLNDEDTSTASYNADLYNPVSNTFSSAGANAYPRLYHSVALLLPDATVWVAGGNPTRGTYTKQIETYKPTYLFNSDGSTAMRPSISSAPSSISYGNTFTVSTPDAANISSVVLVRNGAVTHAFGMDQREVGLAYSVGTGALTVTAPPSGDIAPPGYYMLFLLNSSGVPSVATFVQMTGATPADFSLAATPTSQTVLPGASTTYSLSVGAANGFNGTVGLTASGLPSGTSAMFAPANVTGSGSSTLSVSTASSTPAGTYKLIVTGTSGILSHSVTVSLVVGSSSTPNFSISVSPTARSVSPGNTATYAVKVSDLNGFAGTVSFHVGGLFSGATASFSPVSVIGAGSSTLSVRLSTSTPLGTYRLTVTATSGSLSHAATVSLSVQTFSLTVSPSLQSVARGSKTSYRLTTQASFSSAVTFTVSGLPAYATAAFSPTSLAGSGHSTLTISTKSTTPVGTFTLTISAYGGGLTRTAKVQLETK